MSQHLYELKHQRGQLNGKLVEVNCATLRGDNAMSALFGHTKGAFTCAQSARLGLLREERDAKKPLTGFIELDDAYLGGERSGGKVGRGAAGKTPFVAAVQTTANAQPERIKLQVVDGFRKDIIKAWAKQAITPGSTVISDGLHCFRVIEQVNCEHDRIVCGGCKASVKESEFYWVNTTLG